jgi:hypothetical protein
MAATHRYPIIPPSVLARAHQQYSQGMTLREAAKANALGYTALRTQLRNAGYSTAKQVGRKDHQKGWDASLAKERLSMPLRAAQ